MRQRTRLADSASTYGAIYYHVSPYYGDHHSVGKEGSKLGLAMGVAEDGAEKGGRG